MSDHKLAREMRQTDGRLPVTGKRVCLSPARSDHNKRDGFRAVNESKVCRSLDHISFKPGVHKRSRSERASFPVPGKEARKQGSNSFVIMESQDTGGKIINPGLEDEMEARGYRPCAWKVLLVALGSLCSGGLLLLLLYRRPGWRLPATCRPSSLGEARWLLLRTTDQLGQWAHVKLRQMTAPGRNPLDGALRHWDSAHLIRYFSHQGVNYYWNPARRDFETFKGLEDAEASCGALARDHGRGLAPKMRDYRSLFFGKNEIDVRVPSVLELLVKEVLNPFYLFQLFAIILWAVQYYFLYSISMLFFSSIFVGVSLYLIRKHYVRLRHLVAAHCRVHISLYPGNGDAREVTSDRLVPGDVVAVPAGGLSVPCDAALLCGSCVVDESTLTGESVPVTKTAVPDSGPEAAQIYRTERHRRHTIFCGSRVLRSRGAKALVIATGFATKKGQLVRSILYPQPTDIRLHRDAKQFLTCMVVLAALGVVYAVAVDLVLGVSGAALVLDALNVTLIAVPPVLPLALTCGLLHAQRRLRRAGIFCISPRRINVSGQLDVLCFDKTGTLTEDALDMRGARPVRDGTFLAATGRVAPGTSLAACMATCHSLIVVDGQPRGDPLDVKVFGATGSILEEATPSHASLYGAQVSAVVRLPDQGGQLGTVRQFPFSSALQRMSVIVRRPGRPRFDVYLKGAPETVARLCRAPTVPADFAETLESYTRRGLRVIALAHGQTEPGLTCLQVQSLNREQVESNLDLLGLLIMQNQIKEGTAGVLLDLRRAGIRTLMLTGDNLSTAISVARRCGMIGAGETVTVAEAAPPGRGCPASVTWRRYPEEALFHAAATMGAGGRREEEQEEQQEQQEAAAYHFAASGPSFAVMAEHFPQLAEKFLLRATVLARMTPEQKTQLVAALQSMDYTVGMCGDGANDCGSLKKAHSGMALSQLEASVASPFTSSVADISCVIQLIRQGRGALVTTFCVFKFITLFSLILFCGVVLLYAVLSNYGDWQYFLVDTVMLCLIVFTMSLNPPWQKLARRRPPDSLLSGPVLSSLLLQVFNCLLFQLLAFVFVRQQTWYQTPQQIGGRGANWSRAPGLNQSWGGAQFTVKNFENTSLFYVSAFQYVVVAVVFAKGKPFRQASYKNWSFVLTCAILYLFLLFILLYPVPALEEAFEIASVPYEWRTTLLALISAHAVLSFISENLILDTLWKIFPGAAGVRPIDGPPSTNKTQTAGERISSTWACWKGPPAAKYQYLTVKLREEAKWPPEPSSVTYANPDYLISQVF
ncbi:polyamine-transporting ATPase 13A3-like [Stigmatopora nigra]